MKLEYSKKTQLILLCLLLSSCSFLLPHKSQKVPSIEVLILNNNAPLIHNEVIFANSETAERPCLGQIASATSDINGHASINADSELKLVFEFGDKLQTWEICVQDQNKTKLLWKAKYIGDVPQILKLKCDLAKDVFIFSYGNTYGEGVCELIIN